MKKILLIFILILTTTTVFSATKTVDWVDGAAEQIIYLKERNLSISKGELKGNKWYIYFLGSNKQELSEIIDDRPSKKLHTFSSGYLKKVNDLLIELNKSTKVAMYVALTDYDTPIRTPLIPSGTTLDEKVTNLQERIRSFSTADKLKGSKNDFIKAQKGYAAYQAFFNEKLELLYKKAKLNATGKKVYLPLLAAHYVHKYDKKILYGTYTVRYPDVGEQVKKEIKEIYEATFATIGKNSQEKSIERIVRACISQDKGDYDKIIKGGISTEIPKNSELGERAANNTITPSEVDFSINKNLLDFAGLLTEEEKQDFINSISFSRNILNGMTMRVLLTDSNTKQDILEEIEDLKPTDKEYFIWVHVNTLNTEYEVTVKNLTSEKTAQKIAFATAHWTERMWKNEELNLGKGSVAVLKANLVFTNMFLKFVSDTLKATQIPEKYWNPLHKDENNKSDYPVYMKAFVKTLAISTGNIGAAFDTDLAQKEFAFKCGLWNGLIDQFKGLADLGVLATDYLVDPEKAKAFDDNLNQLTIAKIWDSFKKAHGYEKDKETNYFKLSHQLGKDVITVASLFIGVGELSALAKTGKLSSTVALTKNIDKLSKAVKGGAIKIIKTSPKLAGLLKKLPKTIVAEVKKIGLKSYLILTVNKTKLAKISDDVVFSEMKLLQEGAIVKYTDGSDIVFNNAKYIDNGVEKTGTLSIVKNGDEVGVKLANGGRNIDELFVVIKNHPDFQGFKSLCINNPKISVKLADDEWDKFVASTKSSFGIGRRRNIVKMEFDGKEYLIASGKGYNGQMIGSGKFIPEKFVLDIDKGQRVFTPSISTRHLDTESLGLEYFAKLKNAVKGGKYPKVTGRVKITSDLCPCPSCSAIFQQFSDMFPNVTIDITTTTKLHY